MLCPQLNRSRPKNRRTLPAAQLAVANQRRRTDWGFCVPPADL